MEALVFLLLVVIAVCFVVPLVAITKAAAARRSVENFETRLRSLETELQMLRRTPGESAAEQPFVPKTEAAERKGFISPTVEQPSELKPTSIPPPLPQDVLTAAASVPSPAPAHSPAAEPLPLKPSLPAINW